MAAARRALIIGGSMAGLFAGHFLRRAGWRADIFERTAGPLSARGAGIMTHPELRASLDTLGLETTRDFGVPIATRVVLDRNDDVVARLPFPQIATSWTRLHVLLAEVFPAEHYHTGADLIDIDETADHVVARFADGRTATGDILIGADGIRSTVRRALCLGSVPEYAGYIAWRGMLPEADLAPPPYSELPAQFAFCLPEGEQMIGYLVAGGGNDLRPGHRNYNFVWYRPADAQRELPAVLTDRTGAQHELSIPPQLIAPAVTAAMRTHAGKVLAPWFQSVVARTAQPFLQPIYDLAVPRMAAGRMALMGDAAFVVRPHVGGGVVKAAGDAEALASALGAAPTDLAAALAAYSDARCIVGHKMIAQARRLGSYLKYSYASEQERAAAAIAGTPQAVLRETAMLDFLRDPG